MSDCWMPRALNWRNLGSMFCFFEIFATIE
jgi:hypothetical protein